MARLNNLNKLYLVPVLAVRELLASKQGDGAHELQLSRLRQEELIARVDRDDRIAEQDVDTLYDLFRYGRRLAIQLYLLPDDYEQTQADAAIEQALRELAAAAGVVDEEARLNAPDQDDYSGDEVGGQMEVCDHVRFGDVLEIRFRYLVLHRFLNRLEESDQVWETRYGYVWLCPPQRYLALLAKDNVAAQAALQAVGAALKVVPKPVQFPKELIDRHFPLENARRLAHLDPSSGVRQTIAGDKAALAGYRAEIGSRERSFLRPGALYDEEIDGALRSGLGVTARRGRIYFTRTLSASQVQRWAGTRLRAFVADLHRILAERPEKVYLASAVIRRLPDLDAAARMHLETIADAAVHARREGVQTVQLDTAPGALHAGLGEAWLQPRLGLRCAECEEVCNLCPHCGATALQLVGEKLGCTACGTVLSEGGIATLRCINDHLQRFPIGEMLGYIPTQKLRNLITRVMTQIDLPWNPKRDTIYLDDGGLHWLSAPPDSTVNQYFGDTIVAQVGAGAQHVTIGKDIQVQAGGQDGDEG